MSISYNIYQNESRVSDRVNVLLNESNRALLERNYRIELADSLSLIKKFYMSKYSEKTKEINAILLDTLKSPSIKGKDENEKLDIIRSIINNDTIADY